MHVEPQEFSADDIVDIVERGGRVVIEQSVFGRTTSVGIRNKDGIQYCDTSVKLLLHETVDERTNGLERPDLATSERRQRSEADPRFDR